MAIDPDGYLFVVDGNRVKKFTKDGIFINSFGRTGKCNGEFKSPQGITIDSEGYIYIADTGNHRVQKFKQLK